MRECDPCRQAGSWNAKLDTALKAELVVTAPPELTALLVAMVPALASGAPIRTKRWYRQRLIAALIASVLVSASVILLALGFHWFAQFVGADQIVATVTSWPGVLIEYLYYWLPASQYVVEAILSLREPLQWIVIALLLWRAFDRLRPIQDLTSQSA
ncbi:MAG: anti-sigma factor [Herpetosiphonaceae bacterium]|nr:MAG: anti-sigma factor [Herpetosiphonaceae bacterium]